MVLASLRNLQALSWQVALACHDKTTEVPGLLASDVAAPVQIPRACWQDTVIAMLETCQMYSHFANSHVR